MLRFKLFLMLLGSIFMLLCFALIPTSIISFFSTHTRIFGNVYEHLGFLLFGLVGFFVSLRWMIFMNQKVQNEIVQQVRNHPEKILSEWSHEGAEYIISLDHLVVDHHVYDFGSLNEVITGLVQEPGMLHFHFVASVKATPRTVKVPFPTELDDQIQEAVHYLERAYLS